MLLLPASLIAHHHNYKILSLITNEPQVVVIFHSLQGQKAAKHKNLRHTARFFVAEQLIESKQRVMSSSKLFHTRARQCLKFHHNRHVSRSCFALFGQ